VSGKQLGALVTKIGQNPCSYTAKADKIKAIITAYAAE
jgi:hypothetical protein